MFGLSPILKACHGEIVETLPELRKIINLSKDKSGRELNGSKDKLVRRKKKEWHYAVIREYKVNTKFSQEFYQTLGMSIQTKLDFSR